MSENNNRKLKLVQIVNVDKEGKEVKDENGSVTYLRDDSFALFQLCEAINSKAITVKERRVAISLSDKSREAFLHSKDGIELSVDEAALLKKLLENEDNKDATYPMFFIRTMEGLLEQLR